MKKPLWIVRLIACAAAALAAPVHAEAGRTNGQSPVAQEPSASTYSAEPREKLRSEMDAAERAELSHGDTGMSSSGESAAAARGAAGRSDAQRTREEVRNELGKSSRTVGN